MIFKHFVNLSGAPCTLVFVVTLTFDLFPVHLNFSTFYEKKSTFLPYHVKKNHSTLEVDTFKVMLLLSYLASLNNKPRT